MKTPFQIKVQCQMCGNEFVPVHPTRAKYCSNACKSRYRRAKVRFDKWIAQRQSATAAQKVYLEHMEEQEHEAKEIAAPLNN